MPLDGITLHFLREELSCAIGARIEKIHQPERHSLVVALRGRDFSGRLLLCARPDAPRIHFITTAPENPASPPMFCMFMRKRLTGARLVEIRQEGLDRVLYLDFAATDELGRPTALTLCAELITGKSNVILLQDGKVLDAIRRVYPEINEHGKSARTILPGVVYSPPMQRAEASAAGASALLSREMALQNLSSDTLLSGQGTPILLRDKNGNPRDFSCVPIRQYGDLYTSEAYPDYSTLLSAFYAEREERERLRRIDGGLRQSLETLIARTRRRVESQRTDLTRAGDRDKYRRFADLILSQQYKLHSGSAFYDVDDYENPGETVRIPAEPRLSPAANAQRYYKRYQKARNAEEILRGQIERGIADLEYLENALDALSRASGSEEIAMLRAELTAEGFAAQKSGNTKPGRNHPALRAPLQRRGISCQNIKRYTINDFTILLGKTAAQNERVAFKESRKGDLWLHAQKIAGAHVLIRAVGREIPGDVIEKAAALAAYHSAARESGKAAVDLVQAKNLKKPAAARPGMVIYHEYETIMVEPKDM